MLASTKRACLNKIIVNESDFVIKPGRRLPAETRLELPEMSYAQELLALPIPLENRITYLSPSQQLLPKGLNAAAIASSKGIPIDWVKTKAKEIGVEPDWGGYPEYTAELLEEEWRWEGIYASAGRHISLDSVAKYLGRGRPWVATWAADLGSYPRYRKLGRNREVLSYETGVLYQLRHILLAFPLSNGWYTLGDLATMTRLKPGRVVSILEENGVYGELRRCIHDLSEITHYPPDCLEILEDKSPRRLPPGGEWMTRHAMAEALGKDFSWVSERVKPYQAELRLNDQGKPADHYSRGVYELLLREAEGYELAGEYLGVRGLARVTGKSTSWVRRRLPYISVDSREMLDEGKRSYTHYHPSAAQALLHLPLNVLREGVADNG